MASATKTATIAPLSGRSRRATDLVGGVDGGGSGAGPEVGIAVPEGTPSPTTELPL